MEKFLKELLEQATKDGKVHVIKVEHGEDVQGVPEPDDIYAEVKQEAEHIAKVNKILFDAHVAAGFDEVNALELTLAVIGNNNN